ncbi:MAG: AlbA family DNA-binding domain-containing protein [Gaiella sp.]
MVFLAVLAAGLALGLVARLVLPGRSGLSLSATAVVGIAGAGVGLTLAELLGGRTILRVGLALGCTVLLLAAATVYDRRRTTPRALATSELVAGGETGRVEFKSTARRNLQTGERDARMELVVAKSLAGFLNADGGTLLVGVADDGTILGVETDYELCRKPDRDGFELWLRDFLSGRLGTAALADVELSFEALAGREVCRIDVAPSSEPVFLAQPGGARTADLYVRMGNSTRKLLTDEALAYAQRRFG